MNSKKTLLAALLAALMLTSGCGSSASQQQTDTAAQTGETGTSNVASASDMTEVEEVVEEGMTPISGDKVKDGTYSVAVKSSSKMFDITACELTVEGGKMTATMHMGGKGYLYVYMGTGEQAAAADEADYIPFTEEADGTHSFTVPVDALDEGIDCAAFSKKKEKWYDRTILFRADSLPMDAFADGVVTTPDSLSLADGAYTADVALAGGSGRASVQSPAELTVKDGKMQSARVDMGAAILAPREIPVDMDGENVISAPIVVDEKVYHMTCVSMGNPHCVIFQKEDVDDLDLTRIGPKFEHHPLFPERVNTEFVNVLPDGSLKMRVWERGSGETWACGTGSCATGVAACLNGFANKNEDIVVHLRGGDLTIRYTDETVFMTGAATTVFKGEIEI